MEIETRLSALLKTCERLAIDVRYESMGGLGAGLCSIGGRKVLFVDTAADLESRYDRLLRELAWLPELDDVFLAPELRAEIEACRNRRAKQI